ncbi:hypothetical protein HanPSC8_Chr09g0366401 [Helianthus annuus]|nr:hypothetical protein HanPSC8_Chr09g0366401 [Helianthus annuus]
MWTPGDVAFYLLKCQCFMIHKVFWKYNFVSLRDIGKNLFLNMP